MNIVFLSTFSFVENSALAQLMPRLNSNRVMIQRRSNLQNEMKVDI